MTDRELMQQALDALEDVADDAEESHKTVAAIEAIRARLAQPELEPVAQMREMLEVQGRDGTWNYDTYSQGMYNGMEFMVALAEGREPVFREPPERWLHTPPQREWQGLTDGEIMSLLPGAVRLPPGWADTARTIEAKLKEKNT
jgi:hypothetical protein